MKFYTVRDLRTHPREVWEKLSEVHEVIITNNGKPSALMIEIDDESFEDMLASVRQSVAMRAVNKLRLASIRSGKAEITSEEIDAEISQVRKEKRK
ncbi:antitoxin Phd_YefM of type II toxin-antitoxin system [Anaerobacterium chartisolvens]|uniref:Antitoxin n=1 Tax=Anaerobacterium chartisolvens TaxID=1297424 RepID=A0A369ASC6_9FIRM|nr:type II toxin-antitoxin system Phd/YefM family antitoxin [Anaerobacterium chartisolvens]RCX10354.1 antitoxin Phd_YefM of type II toxin-antitoxin system [Anaerobacterium chartisolvens]